MKKIVGCALVSLLAGCGGGPVPSTLETTGVEIAVQRPEKRLAYRNSRLNLVKHIVPIPADSVLIAGNQLICTVRRSGTVVGCVELPVDLWELDLLRDSEGLALTIVGSGGWGQPSVAVLDVKGTMKWKFDGGYDLMDTPFVLQARDADLVVVGNRVFELATGRSANSRACACGAVASADFDGDGKRDLLRVSSEGRLSIANGDGRELASVLPAAPIWFEPIVGGQACPFVALSKNEEIIVYDRELRQRRGFRTPGAMLPLHASAATFFDEELNGPFAVLVKGRGGWHRTILFVFAADGRLIYKEILDDDYQSILAYPPAARSGVAFLVGGRGEVWAYEFH